MKYDLKSIVGRDVPGSGNIMGIAHANAAVTVNGQPDYRKGEYYQKELALNNTSAAVWQSVTNIASLSGTNQTNIGNVFVPKTAETFAFDADGSPREMANPPRMAWTSRRHSQADHFGRTAYLTGKS